jgi:hypothetical protein
MKRYYLYIKILAVAVSATVAVCVYAGGNQAENTGVIASVMKGKEYYHLEYALKKENIVSLDALTDAQLKINGGQFEVKINKSVFPIDAPNCKSSIILRMPWTNPELANYEVLIDEKLSAYNEIKKVINSSEADLVVVVVELNPYVRLKNNKLELTQCNVFFRHANGRYIPHTGNLK